MNETLAVETENIFQSTDIGNKNFIRTRIITFLNSNLSNLNWQRALKTWKRKMAQNDLIFTKADKGSYLVVMKRVQYVDKILDFLNSVGFEPLNRYPTTSIFDHLRKTR